jgi:hypothetical protein
MSTGARSTRIAELTVVFWGASWLSLFISVGLVVIAWVLRADLGSYLVFHLVLSLILSSVFRSLSEAASYAMYQKDRNGMANSLRKYVLAENTVADENSHEYLKIAS